MEYPLSAIIGLCNRFEQLTGLQAVILSNRDSVIQVQNKATGFYRSFTTVSDFHAAVDILESVLSTR